MDLRHSLDVDFTRFLARFLIKAALTGPEVHKVSGNNPNQRILVKSLIR